MDSHISEITMLSQTNLKHWEKGCKRKWRSMWIDKVVPFYSNAAMDNGKYFEYKCLGGGATDEEVTDLPRLKNGNMSTDHKRIDQQVIRFGELYDKNHKDYLGYEITGDQIELTAKDGISRGTLDYSTLHVETNKVVIKDLKLTGDVGATRHWAHWGNDDKDLEVTQAVWYIDLWEQNYGFRPTFKYLIFDYKRPKTSVKQVTVDVTDDQIEMLNIRKDNVYNEYEDVLNDHGSSTDDWPTEPERYECASCPLNCKDRVEEFKYK